MALDSETKRRSVLATGLAFLVIAPLADASIDAVDREHVTAFYAGIEPASLSTDYVHILSTTAINPYHVTDSGSNLLVKGQIESRAGAYIGGIANYTAFSNAGIQAFSGTAKITGLKLNIVAKTAAYTATATDDIITCGAGNETFTVDLPVPVTGKIFFIKNVGTGIITVDADTTGSTTIDGEITQTVNQDECLQVICDASVYWVV